MTKPVLFPGVWYRVGVGGLLAGLAATVYHRTEYFDDAWFAEQSFWLLTGGRVRSELFSGLNGWETRLYVFHKLFIYTQALLFRLVGISVATSKLTSLLFSGLGGWLVWQYNRTPVREQRWLAVLLYVGCGSLIRFSAAGRPETMCMALGFWSYLFLDQVLHRQQPVLAGALAGLAALTHLNGLIYVASGAGWLLLHRRWRSAGMFSLTAGVVVSLYAFDALVNGEFGTMLHQFRLDPATQRSFGWASKLTTMLNYHHIFFHGRNEAPLSGLVLISGLLVRRRIRGPQPALAYTLLLLGTFWLLTKSDTDVYFLLFLPWLCSLCATWLTAYLLPSPARLVQLARGLVIAYVLLAFVTIYYVLDDNRTQPDVETHNQQLARRMPHKGTKIIAPLEFFFGQINQFQIQSLTYYYYRSRQTPLVLPAFFALADAGNVEYIISDHRLNESYDIPAGSPGRIGFYTRVYQDRWSSLYVHRCPNGVAPTKAP